MKESKEVVYEQLFKKVESEPNLVEYGLAVKLNDLSDLELNWILVRACEEQELRIIKFFARCSKRITDALPEKVKTAIHVAARLNLPVSFDLLTEIYDKQINYVDPADGDFSHFQAACKMGHAGLAESLLTRGLYEDVNSILGVMLKSKPNARVLDLLLGSGARPNLADANGTTLLSSYCRQFCSSTRATEADKAVYLDMVRIFIRYQASVNHMNNEGVSPVQNLYRHGILAADLQLEVLKLLIQAGADVNYRSNSGESLLHYVLRRRYLAKCRQGVRSAQAHARGLSGAGAARARPPRRRQRQGLQRRDAAEPGRVHLQSGRGAGAAQARRRPAHGHLRGWLSGSGQRVPEESRDDAEPAGDRGAAEAAQIRDGGEARGLGVEVPARLPTLDGALQRGLRHSSSVERVDNTQPLLDTDDLRQRGRPGDRRPQQPPQGRRVRQAVHERARQGRHDRDHAESRGDQRRQLEQRGRARPDDGGQSLEVRNLEDPGLGDPRGDQASQKDDDQPVGLAAGPVQLRAGQGLSAARGDEVGGAAARRLRGEILAGVHGDGADDQGLHLQGPGEEVLRQLEARGGREGAQRRVLLRYFTKLNELQRIMTNVPRFDSKILIIKFIRFRSLLYVADISSWKQSGLPGLIVSFAPAIADVVSDNGEDLASVYRQLGRTWLARKVIESSYLLNRRRRSAPLYTSFFPDNQPQ
ncbi:unnamed protein product [Trichogramma brassicae]|uniref:Uncharacterized protein n=1 Tax=Trichogramma brassicae TaxID=86971 RepID=A0A6H5IGD6_9HYME|nr:unnamed protein product [Trichogramma brassicae]